MALTPPNLDDRTFQQIVDEAKKRIPAYFDGWTDEHPSDPGITLIELFAWMTEIILYRQNQLPDFLTVKMMQFFGMNLDEAKAAQTEVTFQLAAPVTQDKVEIPAATEVATTQTETQPSIIFSTEKSLTIYPANVAQTILKRQAAENPTTTLDNTQEIGSLFSQEPLPDDAIYFGFDQDMSKHLLHFFFACDPKYGTDGIDTTRPPYVWEGAVRDENGEVNWTAVSLQPHEDETRGLLQPGRMIVHAPTLQQVAIDVAKEPRYWLRLRVRHAHEYPDNRTRRFTQSPRVSRVQVSSMGGSVLATHAEIVKNEFLGYSDGTPGQRFWLQAAPLLRPSAERGKTLIVKEDGNGQKETKWRLESDFGQMPTNSLPKARQEFSKRQIFTLDTNSGELRLPPTQTDATGNVQLYGEIPPRNSTLWFKEYRHGGGAVGNVGAYALNTLKTAVPSVNRVYNRQAASGGQDQEPIAMAKLRAPQLLHAQNRAITAADFEYLATRADVAVGRVKCLQHEPGWVESVDPGTVYLFVLPQLDEPEKPLTRTQLTMPTEACQKIKTYLDERRLLTTRLHIASPEIVWVQVNLTCKVRQGTNLKKIEENIKERLYTFLNPLVGGSDKTGWPFG
ncbi:MAG: putative baseplate assembly protein, partial [Anaerolineales bacterium]|nr:putative baseplate assembly protein [Anaerolineales bacterium]